MDAPYEGFARLRRLRAPFWRVLEQQNGRPRGREQPSSFARGRQGERRRLLVLLETGLTPVDRLQYPAGVVLPGVHADHVVGGLVDENPDAVACAHDGADDGEQRVIRLRPKTSFSCAMASDGSSNPPNGARPGRKVTLTLATRCTPNST